MRSFFALASAAWFIGAAILIGDGRFGTAGDAPNTEVLGDPAVMAVYAIGRIAFVGVALLSLGLVDWPAVLAFFALSPSSKESTAATAEAE
ncbi:MAG TPA: hypothetical protein VHR55_05470 [Candidatus Limnocylindria bacterium]|nr:hypothetical protein [Candidatus Limnocylindria bacterium]